MLSVAMTIAFLSTNITKADVGIYKTTTEVKLIKGQCADLESGLIEKIINDSYAEISEYSVTIENINITNTKVINKTVKSKHAYVKTLKTGTASLVITGKITDHQYDDESETTKDIVSPYELTINVNVVSAKNANAQTAKAAKKILKKASKKAMFAYVDINFDGYKDLIVGTKVYLYQPPRYEYDELINTPGYVVEKMDKLDKLYIDTVNCGYYAELKAKSNEYTTGKICIYDKFTYNISLNASPKVAQLNKKGQKKFGTPWAFQRDDDRIELTKLTDQKFKSLVKKCVPKKKLVKKYKNTSANVKKYVK